ncbi:hypothetical protein [uncultured Dysosmobacter sp.]|uniref:hypothetical protein n=1 Tax=uncultured Dysosmobacter sp. TaxID=2591384 RepID=UPI0026349380|nr:hypothetical protein [uncultured Dysosmobacter sp.]
MDTKAPFLLTVNGRFLFGATEKKMGVHSRAAKRHIPRPRPQAEKPRPAPAARNLPPRLVAGRSPSIPSANSLPKIAIFLLTFYPYKYIIKVRIKSEVMI